MIKFLLAMFVILSYTQADTIHFKNGATLTGTIENQNKQTITLNGTTYSMSDVKNVSKTTVAPPPAVPTPISESESAKSAKETATTEVPKQRLIGPAGATGVIRRSNRRQGRRSGASID